MPYTFGPMPTLDQFVVRVAEEYDVKRHSGVTLIGTRGATTVEYLTRKVDGQTFDVALPAKAEPLNPHVVCQLCKRLNIPVEDFGFNLGELPAPDDSFSF